jgi:hypothetical protein
LDALFIGMPGIVSGIGGFGPSAAAAVPDDILLL